MIIKTTTARSYLLQAQLQMQFTGASFCILLWSNYQLLSKFYYFLILSFSWDQTVASTNSRYVRAKEVSKEKLIQIINWKAAWRRMSLQWHLLFKIIIRIYKKVLWENIEIVIQKLCVSFLYFLCKWRGVNPTSMSKNIILNQPHTKQKTEEKEQKYIQLHNHHFQSFWKISSNCS